KNFISLPCSLPLLIAISKPAMPKQRPPMARASCAILDAASQGVTFLWLASGTQPPEPLRTSGMPTSALITPQSLCLFPGPEPPPTPGLFVGPPALPPPCCPPAAPPPDGEPTPAPPTPAPLPKMEL